MTSAEIGLLIMAALTSMMGSGAICMGLGKQKLNSDWKGFWFGAILPFISILLLLMVKDTDEALANDMYSRDLIDKQQFTETIETKIKK